MHRLATMHNVAHRWKDHTLSREEYHHTACSTIG